MSFIGNKVMITKAISVLWIAWSLLHIIPGLFTMMNALSGDISSISFLFPNTQPDALTRDYPEDVRAILVTFGQHGFNLFWFGLVAIIGAFYIWIKPSRLSLILTAVVIGFADAGAIFATFMVGRIDVFGILIFSGTLAGLTLSFVALKQPFVLSEG